MIESDATTSDTVKSKEMDNFHFSKMGKDVSGSEIKLFREAIEKLTSPHKDSSFYEGQGFNSFMKKALEDEVKDSFKSPMQGEIELTTKRGMVYESNLQMIRETVREYQQD